MFATLTTHFPRRLLSLSRQGMANPVSNVALRGFSSQSALLVRSTGKAKAPSVSLHEVSDEVEEMPSTSFGLKHGMTGVYKYTNRVLVSGEGSWVTTDDGNRMLDFTSGIGVTNLGHSHPHIVAAAQEQMARISHCQMSMAFSQTTLRLMQRMMPHLPKGMENFFFASTGAEAVEAAVKMAKFVMKRPNLIVFQGSYHGRSTATSTLTTAKTVYRAGFGPLMSNVYVAPTPYFRHLPKGLSQEQAIDYCLEQLEILLLQQSNPQDTAAMIIEPVLGEGGYVVMPDRFLRGIREICNRHGILMILDEVQTGYGRTGKMFALEYSGVQPDILIMAKGIANGMPLSCIVSNKEMADATTPGSMGGTYGGNAVACASAIAVLDIFESEPILDNVLARGQQLAKGLKKMQAKGYPIAEVRGRGLMVGVEFIAPSGSASKIVKLVEEDGMMILPCGAFESVRFIPPLNVTEEEINIGLSKFEMALKKVFPNVQ